MRWPAIRSAETAASWMAAMVLSRLTTTPLRRPSHRASPTPTTLTAPPTSSDSAMITATRLVPRSRPTVFFRRDKTVLRCLLVERWDYGGGLNGIIEAAGVSWTRFCGSLGARGQRLCVPHSAAIRDSGGEWLLDC